MLCKAEEEMRGFQVGKVIEGEKSPLLILQAIGLLR